MFDGHFLCFDKQSETWLLGNRSWAGKSDIYNDKVECDGRMIVLVERRPIMRYIPSLETVLYVLNPSTHLDHGD